MISRSHIVRPSVCHGYNLTRALNLCLFGLNIQIFPLNSLSAHTSSDRRSLKYFVLFTLFCQIIHPSAANDWHTRLVKTCKAPLTEGPSLCPPRGLRLWEVYPLQEYKPRPLALREAWHKAGTIQIAEKHFFHINFETDITLISLCVHLFFSKHVSSRRQ